MSEERRMAAVSELNQMINNTQSVICNRIECFERSGPTQPPQLQHRDHVSEHVEIHVPCSVCHAPVRYRLYY